MSCDRHFEQTACTDVHGARFLLLLFTFAILMPNACDTSSLSEVLRRFPLFVLPVLVCIIPCTCIFRFGGIYPAACTQTMHSACEYVGRRQYSGSKLVGGNSTAVVAVHLIVSNNPSRERISEARIVSGALIKLVAAGCGGSRARTTGRVWIYWHTASHLPNAIYLLVIAACNFSLFTKDVPTRKQSILRRTVQLPSSNQVLFSVAAVIRSVRRALH